MLRKRAVAATNLTGFMVGLAMFSSFLIIPQFAQAPEITGYGFGFSVTEAGLLLMPIALAQLLGRRRRRRGSATRIGFRALLTLGAALITTLLPRSTPSPTSIRGSSSSAASLLGAGITFAFAAMANLIVEAVPHSEVGIATGINTVMRTVGGSFGAAIVTAILTAGTTPLPTERRLHDGVRVLRGGWVLALIASRLVPRRGSPRMTPQPVTDRWNSGSTRSRAHPDPAPRSPAAAGGPARGDRARRRGRPRRLRRRRAPPAGVPVSAPAVLLAAAAARTKRSG